MKPYAVPTTLQAATAYQLTNPAAPGKARSSMNLSSISGRQPVQQQAVNPYLQQLYAMAALQQQQQQQQQLTPQMLGVMQGVSTGNPLLDMYAAQTAGGQLIPAGLPATSSQLNPAVTQSLSIDSSQAGAQMAWGMLGYPSAPVAAQALPTAGLSAAAVEYAAAAGPTTAAGLAQQQQQQQDSRFQ